MQSVQKVLTAYVVEGKVVGAIFDVVLYLLIALGEIFYQDSCSVEVGNNLILIAVKTFL